MGINLVYNVHAMFAFVNSKKFWRNNYLIRV